LYVSKTPLRLYSSFWAILTTVRDPLGYGLDYLVLHRTFSWCYFMRKSRCVLCLLLKMTAAVCASCVAAVKWRQTHTHTHTCMWKNVYKHMAARQKHAFNTEMNLYAMFMSW